MQNVVNMRKLTLFGPKCLNLGLWNRNFQKQFLNQYIQNRVHTKFVRIRKLILFGQKCPNLGIWVSNLRNES